MKLDIGTVTATRLWSKALSRIGKLGLHSLEDEIKSLNLTDDYCEVLQINFQDEGTAKSESDGFVKTNRVMPKEKVKQVSMIVPSGFSFKRDGSEDEALFKAVLERTIIAIQRSHLTPTNKMVIEETIRKHL
jgi:hypothetical protein